MYLAVDIGGTKTLLGLFTKDGQLKETFRFETPEKYDTFLAVFRRHVEPLLSQDVDAVCVGAPGVIDRQNGVGIRFGNLPWKNVPLQKDIEQITSSPAVVENDAKLAGLFEAINIINDYKKVVYITISTGIGISLTVNGVIDQNMGDRGGNGFMLEVNGKMISWENLASGKAITERYGKKASDINDPKIWRILAKDFARGIIEVIALVEPEAIVIGGGVGAHFDKFGAFLREAVESYKTPITKYPAILPAKKPEEAVIYGCYQLAQDTYGKVA